jgi:hypothetical protein
LPRNKDFTQKEIEVLLRDRSLALKKTKVFAKREV